MQCPCKSKRAYSECCEPFHTKTKYPSSPLELMRSRYSAYVLGLVEYLIETDTRSTNEDSADIEAFSKGVEWIGLEILDHHDNIVEFKAYYNLHGKTEAMHEKSVFSKHDGVWKYDNGELFLAKIERNAPCPCGSGKKFKKCCLR